MSTPALAVTGATGFLGGALASRLAADGARPIALGRRFERAADRLGGLEQRHLDLADPGTFGAAVAGVDVVYHLAAWVGRRRDAARAAALNVDATGALVRAAAAAGARRFVLVSTVAAYGEPRTDLVTEDHPLDLDQVDPYGRTKARGEGAATAAAREAGIELVVVRPGMVYGPGSIPWTATMAALVRRGAPVLFGSAQGTCFPVYVDDVIDALLLAGTVPAAAGRAFHLSDRPVTWARWFQYFGDMCGRRPRRLPMLAARAVALAAERLPLGIPLNRAYLRLYARKITFDTTRARTELGWAPKVSLDEGMSRAEAWLRASGRLGADA